MLKKFVSISLAVATLFSMFLTPMYAAQNKTRTATELKEVTGVTSTRENYMPPEHEPHEFLFETYDVIHVAVDYSFAIVTDINDNSDECNAEIIDINTRRVVGHIPLVKEDKFGYKISGSQTNRYLSILTPDGPAIYDTNIGKLIYTESQYNYIEEFQVTNSYSIALVNRYNPGDRNYSSETDTNKLRLIDLQTGEDITNKYGNNIHHMEMVYSTGNNNPVGLAIFKNDNSVILDYLNHGMVSYEYKNANLNSIFIIEGGKYIIENSYQSNYGAKVYDIKTNNLLATSSNIINYVDFANIFIVTTLPDENNNYKTYIYNTEGKKLGEFNTNVHQIFVDVSDENNLNTPIITYHDHSVNVYNPAVKYYQIMYS